MQKREKTLFTMLTASGYITSVITPRCEVTYSTISNNAPRLTSFHLRSLSGSATKSNRTQHCWIFCTKSSSLSAGAASKHKLYYKNVKCLNPIAKFTFEQRKLLQFSVLGNIESRRALSPVFDNRRPSVLDLVYLCWWRWTSCNFRSRRR